MLLRGTTPTAGITNAATPPPSTSFTHTHLRLVHELAPPHDLAERVARARAQTEYWTVSFGEPSCTQDLYGYAGLGGRRRLHRLDRSLHDHLSFALTTPFFTRRCWRRHGGVTVGRSSGGSTLEAQSDGALHQLQRLFAQALWEEAEGRRLRRGGARRGWGSLRLVIAAFGAHGSAAALHGCCLP